MRIFGFDIGTTSIGFATIDIDEARQEGSILRLGARIFPEARDPDGTPLNQQRRSKRMMRRQLRRRKERRKALNSMLSEAGLLPAFSSPEWNRVMSADPYALRARGLDEPLEPYEIGRALYHLAKRRHFKARDLEEEGGAGEEAGKISESTKDEEDAKSNRDATLKALANAHTTLGKWLAAKPAGERKRGVHATRDVVVDEFNVFWDAQAKRHPSLLGPALKEQVEHAIFAQKPVFWRTSTLGQCRLEPGAQLCPKGSWLSQQRRMLEKLNNLAIAGGNARPLDHAERAAILAKLQTQASMSWSGVRKVLEPLFKARGESARNIKFNLEMGGDGKLLGNPLEAKFADIFGSNWPSQPNKDAIRNEVQSRLWAADYGRIGTQRVVILSEQERKDGRAKARNVFIQEFGVTEEQAEKLASIKLPQGWEPYSIAALQKILPELEKGERFGTILNSPERRWVEWRNENFPNREQPTGEVYDRLPSPTKKHPDELSRIKSFRNPTVVRTQNELRKVVNNLISLYGKPDLIRVELARDVGKSKREREEIKSEIRKQERKRRAAEADLKSKGISSPSCADIEKWLLWKESQERCPYSRNQIGFDDLFRRGLYEVEHIWPLPRSLDDSFKNKTLCHRDWNQRKGKRTPFEAFGHTEEWAAIKDGLDKLLTVKDAMSPGKIRRFLAESMPEDFASRQLTDTRYAARQAVAFLKKLWPDMGPEAPVKVQSVNGKVTAQLRKRWGLNNILSDDGEKTRADHRHHAVDALAVACANPAYVKRLSDYYKKEERELKPHLPEPWPTIRQDATAAVDAIIVSHRVRKKVSGPLHKETVYGDTGKDVTTSNGTYRLFVTTKAVGTLSKGELVNIRDATARHVVTKWVASHGGDPKKAFATFPHIEKGGADTGDSPASRAARVKKVRLTLPMKFTAVERITTGYAATGNNHHIAIYRTNDGKIEADVVSLFEAVKRVSRRESVVRRISASGAVLLMSLSLGDTFHISKGDRAGYWTVKTIAGNGQVFCKPLNSADPSPTGQWGPSPGPLVKLGARKVSVDPIGRIHPAND